MAKTYVIPKLWRVVGVLTFPMTVGTSVFVLIKLSNQFHDKLYIPIVIGTLAIAIILYVVKDIIAIFKTKLIIRDRELEITRHNTEVITFDSIKGFEVGRNYVYIILKNETKPKVLVSLYIEKREEWLNFLSDNFVNLDEAAFNEEIDTLLDDTSFGQTQEDRNENVLKAVKRTRVFNIFGALVTLWLILYPYPSKWVTVVGIITPVIGFIWTLLSGGGIKILPDSDSPYPSLSVAISLPVLGLFVLATTKFTLLDSTLIWLYAFPISIALTYLTLKSLPKEFTTTTRLDRIIVYPLLTGFSMLYLFSAITLGNCTFDDGDTTVLTGQLIKKEIKRENAYHLSFKLPDQTKTYTLNTSEAHYNSIQIGDDVFVQLYSGKMFIPWIRLIVIEQVLP